MKKIILVLTISLFAVSAYAQNSMQKEYDEWKPSQDEYANFDIGKYTTPDIVRNQLDMNFDFRSFYTSTDYSSSDRDVKYEGSTIYGNISASFSRYVNTRKKISSLAGNLSFGEDYNSRNEKQTLTNNSTTIDNASRSLQQNAFNLIWSNKWYFSKLIYMDYGIRSNVSYHFTQNKTKNQSEDDNVKQKDFSYNLSPQLGIGYGRIENVHDARQAVYIANALAKKMVLTRNLSDDELFELSRIASTVKNKRFLDSRLHLIEEITTLDSFFVDNNLLEDDGAAYFTTLNDMWQYGDLFSRRSGYEISFGVRPDYSHQNVKFTPVVRDYIFNTNQHSIGLNFSYEKPFKLNWQHSLFTEVLGGVFSYSQRYKQTDNDYDNNNKGKRISAFAYYSLGYYPNTRTNIRVGTSQQISRETHDHEGNIMIFHSALNASLYYYFSPNLRLTGDFSLGYSPRRNKGIEGYYHNSNDFSSSFFIQLSYYIF